MALVKCAVCGEFIDRSACNQTYGIFTIVKDSDATGTKHIRQYLCNLHALSFDIKIQELGLKKCEQR